MSQHIHIAHQISGRVRIKVPYIKGNAKVAKRLNDMASSVEGVHDVKTSYVTGSMVVHYDKNDSEVKQRLNRALKDMTTLLSVAVPEIGEAKELSEVLAPDVAFVTSHLPVLRPFAGMLKSVDRKIWNKTHGSIDLATLLPLLFGSGFILLNDKSKMLHSSFMLGGLLLMSFHSYVVLHQPKTPLQHAG